MSAYICDRSHVLFLVCVAMNPQILNRSNGLRWHWGTRENPQRNELTPGDHDKAAEVANMLWRENIASVAHRYNESKTSANLPGPVGDNFLITAADIYLVWQLDPVQVFKSINCYEYQSCEHDGWRASEAHAFCRALESAAIHALPGYDDAEWGAPDKHKTRRR